MTIRQGQLYTLDVAEAYLHGVSPVEARYVLQEGVAEVGRVGAAEVAGRTR